MAGSRMLTAEVLALTTRVDRQVAARTPLARVVVPVSVIRSSVWIGAASACRDGRSGVRAVAPPFRANDLRDPPLRVSWRSADVVLPAQPAQRPPAVDRREG